MSGGKAPCLNLDTRWRPDAPGVSPAPHVQNAFQEALDYRKSRQLETNHAFLVVRPGRSRWAIPSPHQQLQ
jgi:hypothetical protein